MGVLGPTPATPEPAATPKHSSQQPFLRFLVKTVHFKQLIAIYIRQSINTIVRIFVATLYNYHSYDIDGFGINEV